MSAPSFQDIVNYASYSLHGISFVLTAVNWIYQLLYLRWGFVNKKNVFSNPANQVFFLYATMVFGGSIFYFGNIVFLFDRTKLTTTGKLGGPPTTWCTIQGIGITFFTLGIAMYSTITALQVYFSVVKNTKGARLRETVCWLHGIAALITVTFTVIYASLVTAGPLGQWCWVACAEDGVDPTNLNPGGCWKRVLLYGPAIAVLLVSILHLLPMLRILLVAIRKESTSGKPGGARHLQKGYTKTVLFLLTYSCTVLAASIFRITSSITVNTAFEGRIELTEIAGAAIGVIVVSLFGLQRWYLPCTKPPYDNDKVGMNPSDVSVESEPSDGKATKKHVKKGGKGTSNNTINNTSKKQPAAGRKISDPVSVDRYNPLNSRTEADSEREARLPIPEDADDPL